MTTEQITIAQFTLENSITMSVRQIDNNPAMDGGENMDHWLCTVKRFWGPIIGTGENKRPTFRSHMRVTFSQGRGHNRAEPELDAVLSCLASDAILAADSFAGFCANCGYDEDSRKAFRSYQQAKRQTDKLRAFLTTEQFEALLYGTEQL